MALNRRNTLIGLGTLAVGGGALAATGAFTTVEADRTVEVQAVGDASALLGLAIPASSEGATSDAVQIVDGLLTIDFGSISAAADGVNLGALTTIGRTDDNSGPTSIPADGEAFTITNNGSQTVDVGFAIDFHGDQGSENISGNAVSDHLKLWTDVSGVTATIDGGGFANLVASDITGLAPGETALVVIQVDTQNLDATDVNTTSPLFASPATITADAQ